MVMHWSALGDDIEHVLSCLGPRELGRLEAAGKDVDTTLTELCWATLAAEERYNVEWRPWLLQGFPGDVDGKDALRDLLELRAHLNTVPERWSPEITSVSPSALQLTPSDRQRASDANPDAPAVPPFASVPLALGAALGDEMSIGVLIQPNTAKANEGVWFGLEFTGLHDGWGMYCSILCAPLTGRIVVKYPGEGNMLVAQAFEPLPDDLCDSVGIFVNLFESGDVEFVRVCEGSKSVTRSGLMPRAMFPCWTQEIFASVGIQMKDVCSETKVSTKRPADGILQEQDCPCSNGNCKSCEFDKVWSEFVA